MSDAIGKTGCISHRPNSHFFIIHEDFLDVAKVSEHQYKLAAFWRVLETKHNERKIYNDELAAEYQKKGLPEPTTSMWIEIPYSEFEHRTLGTYKSSSFKIAAAESERLGFSQSRVQKRATNPLDPQSPKVDYKEYLFNVEAMQTVLNTGVYPTPVEFDSPLLKGYQDREKKRKESKTPVENDSPPVENDTGKTKTPVENDSPPLSNSTANNIYIGSSKDNKDSVVTAKADDAPTEKSFSQNEKPKGNTTPQGKPSSKTPPVTIEEQQIRKKLHTWINERRGYSLQGRALKGDVLQENTACVTLANLLYRGTHLNDADGCTWEELSDEWTWIAKHDPFWSKPGNKERIGGKALLQMHAQTIGKVRKQKQQVADNQATGGRQLSDLEKRNRAMAEKYGKKASGQ